MSEIKNSKARYEDELYRQQISSDKKQFGETNKLIQTETKSVEDVDYRNVMYEHVSPHDLNKIEFSNDKISEINNSAEKPYNNNSKLSMKQSKLDDITLVKSNDITMNNSFHQKVVQNMNNNEYNQNEKHLSHDTSLHSHDQDQHSH